MHLFMLYPRTSGDGFTLIGTTLYYGLWYRNEFDALSYAHSRCTSGGTVTVVDSHGYPIITERIGPHDTGLRPSAPPTVESPKTPPPPRA